MGLRDKIRGAVSRVMTGGGGPSSPRQPEVPAAKPAAPTPAPRAKADAAAAKSDAPAKADGPAAKPDGEVKPWYLEGQDDIEGWDQTNPGEEPGKTNLRD